MAHAGLVAEREEDHGAKPTAHPSSPSIPHTSVTHAAKTKPGVDAAAHMRGSVASGVTAPLSPPLRTLAVLYPSTADVMTSTPVYFHHSMLHRFLSLGWLVSWQITRRAPATTEDSASSLGHSSSSSSATRRTDEVVWWSQPSGSVRGGTACKVYECPLCPHTVSPLDGSPACSLALLAQRSKARGKALQQWVQLYRQRPTSSPSPFSFVRDALPLLTLDCWRYAADLGVEDGETEVQLVVSLPDAAVSPATRQQRSQTTSHVLPSCSAPLCFFLLPAWSSVCELSSEAVKGLLALPTYPKPMRGRLWSSTPNGTSNPRVFCYQLRQPLKRVPTLSTSSVHAPLPPPPPTSFEEQAHTCACDVLLVLTESSGSTQHANVSDCVAYLTVWGRAPCPRRKRRKQQQCENCHHVDPSSMTASLGPSPSSSSSRTDEFFFIAECLEDYLRVGSAFGWVYGWQLCYASFGPPLTSVPWLRFVNESALDATNTLRHA